MKEFRTLLVGPTRDRTFSNALAIANKVLDLIKIAGKEEKVNILFTCSSIEETDLIKAKGFEAVFIDEDYKP